MPIRHTITTLFLAIGLLTACSNEVEVAASEPKAGASIEVQRLVAEIDAMLVVRQDEYPDGNEFSGVFDELLAAVAQQEPTLRTTQVAQNMGYFIAAGHGIGWDPKEQDIESLARDWREFRADVLAGP